ncbi:MULTISPECIES: acetyl-CoA carboxylase biotin carboxylase subunit [Aeromicrobium]|uniref:acetyl-CoA carboxylase biotin carboxylase subunit n=1 Tax=Aeromicrobium TaxID=2040 RepID=UPI00257ADA07|nr:MULTISPECIES: biotin carboxylase N-terminal domain-containing protein [Aeromicrobium]
MADELVSAMSELPQRVLVANRGEIARRIVTTVNRLGLDSIAVYAPIDAGLPFVSEAAEAYELTSDHPVRGYLDGAQIIALALECRADAIHPGYGFLAENADFAQAVEDAGLTWVGPSPEVMTAMGDKIRARSFAASVGVPISGGGDSLETIDDALAAASGLGYPVMVKASGGGGGIGMAVAHDADALAKVFASTKAMSERSFGSDRVFVEKYLARARHVEVQIVADAFGRVESLGERDCSPQRRHQKVAEESPAPHLSEDVRSRMHASAVDLAKGIGYRSAGTVEFLLDAETEEFVFLEMNTRIQVEHPVTELVWGTDLVEQQLSIAGSGHFTPDFDPRPQGHAFELRICAEDPVRLFPSPGSIDVWSLPSGEGVRVDSGFAAGTEVTPYFDSLVAKLCVVGADRPSALARLREALDATEISGGLQTNLEFLRRLVDSPEYDSGRYDTQLVTHLLSARPAR